MKLAALPVCIFASMALCNLASGAIPASERAVLNAIYTQTNGANWTNNTGWEGAVGSECAWYGVTCDDSQSHVVQIDFSMNNLTGSLPSLAGLTGLQRFFISFNWLVGPIPSLAGMTNLQIFDARGNQMTGSIPSLTGLTNLQQFFVSGNELTGRIPSLAGLTGLQHFYVDSNQLTGSIPSLAGLTNLEQAVFYRNQLTGQIPSLDGLGNLIYLNVSFNLLTGSIPSLAGLTNLEDLELDNNELTGSIPSLAGLPSFETFNAYNNQLTGSIPNLAGAPGLQIFVAFNNRLTGSIPSLTGLGALSNFNVNSNQLTGSIPSLAGLTNLQFFGVDSNQLTGATPSLSGLTSLKNFDVNNNLLTGAIPAVPSPTNSLVVGWSSVCPNLLTPSADSNWDVATGVAPWDTACVTLPSINVAPSSTANGSIAPSTTQSVAYGTRAVFTVTPAAGYYTVMSGTCGGTLAGTTFTTNPLTYDCNVSASFTSSSVNLDQHGLTGSWRRSGVPGTDQGFLLNFYPDNIASGHGTVFAGWYTYDVAGGSGGQRWYALQGDVYESNAAATLGIYTRNDGNLNSGSNPTGSQVGTATLSFSDCSTGTLVYAFDDGRSGAIPLSRVTHSTATCGANGDTGAAPQNYLLSGAWIVPSAVGMGFVIDVSPADNTLLGSWYTYYPAGNPAPSPRQQWFVFQDGDFTPTSTSSSNLALLQSSGGTFDATVGGGVTVTTAGSASLTFTSCTTATFTYAIPTESMSQNTVNLLRLGPAPAGCSL